jgi:hypothetical protein
MYSRLFRRETGKRLRAISGQVIKTYLDRRFAWLDVYSRPSPDGIRDYIRVLAEAVERDNPTLYFDYSASSLGALLDSGTAPIALIAAGDLLQDTILDFLTPDQREAVWDFFGAERQRRQEILRNWLAPVDERGA